MTVTIELPPDVEHAYRDLARAQGVSINQLIRETLLANAPSAPQVGTQGLGLFSNPADATLLDEAVAMALEDRHQASRRTNALIEQNDWPIAAPESLEPFPDEDFAKDVQAGIDSRREPLRNVWDD